MLLHKIITILSCTLLLNFSACIQAGFFEKNKSIYFEDSKGNIHSIKNTYKTIDKEYIYKLTGISKNNKWAIISEMSGGRDTRISELNFLYYHPYKISIDSSLHSSYLAGINSNKGGDFLETVDGNIIYLEDIEEKITSLKYIKLQGKECSGRYKSYSECGQYFNTETKLNDIYLKDKGSEYHIYDKSIENIKLDELQVIPPVISYFHVTKQGYIDNFWHYPSNTKYSIEVNRNKKLITSSHKDYELEKGVARILLKALTKSQDILDESINVIGSYAAIINSDTSYKLYIYEQEDKLRFLLFEPNKNLEIMGGVEFDSIQINFVKQKTSTNSNQNLNIKASKALHNLTIEIGSVAGTYSLTRLSLSDFEY